MAEVSAYWVDMQQTRRLSSSSYPLMTIVLALLLILPDSHLVAGQGLDVASDQLGAGAAATATEFEMFEDALSLSLLGGRGRGSRGGSGNLGGFRDVTDYQQLQASYYYIASSPQSYESSNTSVTPGGKNYVPEPSDQQLCNTCVGQAVATAVQMSVAYTLQEDVTNISVSPLNLYYCSSGGRTCLTGWDIQPALAQMEQNPWLLRPKECFSTSGRNEAEISGWQQYCRNAADQSANELCKGITSEAPYYKCTYKSLSSFYQIQQHIRKHGAVITRIAVPDDFNIQFNYTTRNISGLNLPPYQYNSSAKILYGHAAVIVGYDNENFTWTLLNSWGRGNATGQTRLKGGVTADGMFKIHMGLLGVGTPEKSYGVVCEPAVGRPRNLNGEQPWLTGAGNEPDRRLPVAQKPSNDTECFDYTIRQNDSVSHIVDRFDIDIREFVHNTTRARKQLGNIANLTYKFAEPLRAEELSSVLRIATNVTAGVSEPGFKPFIECWHYDEKNVETIVTCDSLEDAGNERCAINGTVGCTLHYQDINVTATLPPGTMVEVCNKAWSKFSAFNRVAYVNESETFRGLNIAEREAVILQRLRKAFTKTGLTYVAQYEINCTLSGNEVFYPTLFPGNDTKDYTMEWGVYCHDGTQWTQGQPNSTVGGIYIGYLQGNDIQGFPSYLPTLDEEIGYMLLNLKNLRQITISVYNGTLPPQLGGLPKLKSIYINHFCLGGSLPPGWIPALTNLQDLEVGPQKAALNYVDPDGGACGVKGTIPQSWSLQNSSIHYLSLADNMLSGELPVQIGGRWNNLTTLYLNGNRFAGEVPRSWSALTALEYVDLSDNMLSGVFPLTWTALKGRLWDLKVDNNAQLRGCAPLDSYTEFSYNDTRMAGLCQSDAAEVAAAQRRELEKTLPRLLYVDSINSTNYKQAYTALKTYIQNLGSIVNGAQSSVSFWVSRGGDGFNARLNVEVIDGAEYVTELEFQKAALDMTQLAPLLRNLPKIRTFICTTCSKSFSTIFVGGKAKANVLPQDLAAAAPGLKFLQITEGNVTGSLPKSWGKWQSIETIRLWSNKLAGGLPKEWKGMSSLRELDLKENRRLKGRLPEEWGLPGTKLRKDMRIWLQSNEKMQGRIPQSFAYFSYGFINIAGTGIEQGCAPGGITVLILNAQGNQVIASQCVGVDVTALNQLKELLIKTRGPIPQLDTWNISNPASAGPGTPPNYCRWPGVGCDTSYRVSQLNLSALNILKEPLLNLAELFSAIATLTEINTLVLSGVGISGNLNDIGGVLASFVKMQHLNISSNLQITGPLPDYIATLTALQKLIISETGLTGGLPRRYALLQELVEFRAAGCEQLSGQLPVEYGLLSNLQVFEITGSRIVGPLPQEWADPAALGTLRTLLLAESQVAATTALKQLNQAQALLENPSRVEVSQDVPEAEAAVVADMPAPLVPTLPQEAISNFKAARQQSAGAARVVEALQKTMAAKPMEKLGMFALKQLMISNNTGLRSPLPGIYSDMDRLEYIDLSSNDLTGSLPAEWTKLKQLKVLNLGHNDLSGNHPMLWYRLTNLRALYLNDNKFTDSFPAAYTSMRQLAILDIRRSSPAPDFGLWPRFAGSSYRMQCLLLDPALTGPQEQQLTELAQARTPSGEIGFTAASELCELGPVLEDD